MTVVTTSRCNQQCSYCFVKERPPASPPWAAVRSVLDRLLESPADGVTVGFTGGEPLLAKPLIARVVRYTEAHRRPAQRVRYRLLTNGLLLDIRTAAWLERHGFDLQISLDGTRDAQEARSAGTFEALDGLLGRLRRRSPSYFRSHVSVGMTLTPDTVAFLAPSVSYLLDAGVSNIRIGPATGVSTRVDGVAVELDRQFREVLRSARAHFRETGTVPVEVLRKGIQGHRAGASPWRCGAPLGRGLAVDVDGQVSTCLFATATYSDGRGLPKALRAAAGALRAGPPDGGLEHRLRVVRERAAEAGVFAADAHRHSSWGPCSRCEWADDCVVCPLMAVGVSGGRRSFRVPDFTCAFNRVVANYRELFPLQPPPRAHQS